MSLVTLPEELLILILRQLDLESVRNLYDTGNHRIQNVICTQGAIKTCRLSLSTMATAQTLKLNFFKGISNNLTTLDLSAIQDLTKTVLMSAMTKLNCLVTFNVTYTNITILDLLEVYELCPTIKNISINFQFHKTNAKINHFPQETLTKCQDVFANFENVHFVGSVENLLHSNLLLCILQKAKINDLILTTSQYGKMCTYYKYVMCEPLHCNTLTVNILQWKDRFKIRSFVDTPPVIKDLPFKYEYIHIHSCTIDISPGFENYFKENYRYNKVYIKPSFTNSLLLNSNHYIMIWNKETTSFDDNFFKKLDAQIKPLEPCIVTYSDGMPPVVLSNDWVAVNHSLICEDIIKITNEEFAFKRRRVSAPNMAIDYDEMLKDKQKVQLTICFHDFVHRPVILSTQSNFLHKLTFLQLRGEVRYSKEFFNIIFRCCSNLITFDVEGYSISPCTPPVARSIPLSRTVKNLRIVDKNIDLNTLFSSLGQCKKLENVMIIDSSKVCSDIPDVDTFIKQCKNLYYLCIYGTMSDYSRIKKITMLNKIKEKYRRPHLFFEIGDLGLSEYLYDPFVDVYKLVVNENYII